MSDSEIRRRVEDLPIPDFASTPFVRPPALADAMVAIVTTAGLRQDEERNWRLGDQGFVTLDAANTKTALTHFSPNIDRSGFLADPNVVFPLDRLREREEEGTIGSVASRHVAFMGAQPDHTLATMRLDTGPAAARLLKEDGVDVVVLTPVCPYCTRAVLTLAHVFEEAGIATAAISLVKGQSERARAPRVLHCDFPFGRPLGRPNDPAFQHRVLGSALELLDREAGPVLEVFPDRLDEENVEAAVCEMPPRFDHTIPPAVDEAVGLLPAYKRCVDRRGSTHVGRVVRAEGIPAAVAVLVQLANGDPLASVHVPGNDLAALAADVRWYYEEAATELVQPGAGPKAVDKWIYETTELGAVLGRAQDRLRSAGAARDDWFYLCPAERASDPSSDGRAKPN